MEINKEENTYYMMAATSLLITQIKYDLTNEVIAPDSWHKFKIKDYYRIESKISDVNNQIVREQGLSTKLII